MKLRTELKLFTNQELRIFSSTRDSRVASLSRLWAVEALEGNQAQNQIPSLRFWDQQIGN
jgi:hypothetical protein